ncbi:MAG: hypothetical protein RJB66_555 [Pseudomonadota bacterium]|jgi:hypothetical protein
MKNQNHNLVLIRHILTVAQAFLGLVLLALKIYELLTQLF